MSTFSKEEISRRLSQTLDCLGYSSEMIQFRKNFYINCDFIANNYGRLDKLKTVGSRREGIIKFNESDWDILFFAKFILVVEDPIATECIPESASVFHMLPCLLHPGHFKLLLLRYGTEDMFTKSCLNPFANGCYLSSKEFVTLGKEDNRTLSGPAQTLEDHHTTPCSFDRVHTFPCVCPSIIQRWVQRPRRYEWPSRELRERISCMPANIVATGHKGCPDEETEWRLCFNEIELLLVDSWNETQVKLYKVLKMIKKDVFVKAGFEISSYIMKNILLWLSETYPQSDFRSEFLLMWIFKSLRLLRKAVKVHCLPYYMIPGRNLIAERIPRRECKRLMRGISDLIHCGPQLLWECEKLEFAMSMTPNELLYYKYWCDRLEVMINLIFLKCGKNTNTDVEPTYENEILEITMNLQWPPAVTEIFKDKSVLERFQTLLG